MPRYSVCPVNTPNTHLPVRKILRKTAVIISFALIIAIAAKSSGDKRIRIEEYNERYNAALHDHKSSRDLVAKQIRDSELAASVSALLLGYQGVGAMQELLIDNCQNHQYLNKLYLWHCEKIHNMETSKTIE